MSKKFVCLAAVGLMLAIAGSAGAQVGKGKVLFEYWLNIGSGISVDSNLRTNANFPNNPTQSEWRDSFKSKVDWADNMGTRARAFLTAPADGNYTFWVAGDDNCQLWLSTDDTAANAKMIAQVVGWTGAEEWANATEKANQVSVPQALKAGKVYYIEALLKEGGGGDSVSVGWAGPVIGDKTVVIAGTYLTAFIRNPEPLFKAQSPDPANGKTEVTSPLFQWTAGATAVLHEVYMGTNPTPGAAEFMGPWPVNMYFHVLGLTPGAKYYWRVDEVDASGVKTTGDVWSFTVAPLEAHNPDPTDGMAGRSLSVKLTWVAGQGATKHKVFIGADKAKVTAGDASVLVATQAELTFAPTGLAAKTTYYWRVDEVDSTGKVSPGPVWSFSTIDPAGGAVAEYWNDANLMFFNMDLVGAPAVVKTVPNVDLSWPDGTVKGTNSPDPNVNTNYFFGRFTALLNVPTTGTYTLIESSDDGGVLYLDGVLVAGRWATGGEAEFASADLDLVAGQRYLLTYEYFESTGGAAARIRWSGPGISKQAIWQGALMPPDCAIGPRPRNGAAEVPDRAVMTWIPAPKAVVHTVYFGTDKAKVTAGDASVALPPTAEAKYVPAKALTWNTTYYWKVDEMAADGTTVPGQVWSFKTANFIVVGPSQKTLNYDNTATPFMSQLAYDVPADLTAGSVTDLALRFVGQALTAGTFSYDAATGTYAVGGAGADIWGNADQFTYGYKALQGDGSMIARVVSDDGKGANTWSKAGVMIRETLAAGSTHAFMPITAGGGNGRSFQRRLVADLASTNADGPAPTVTVPRWVKIERKGNDFSAFDSVDGKTWNQIGTAVTIVMKDPVLIGLAVTSHLAGTVRTWTLDSVSTTGNVVPDGPITAWKVINTTQNAVAPLYVAIEDKAGKIAMVNHPNPAAVNTTVIDLWRVPMSSFTGIDLKNAAKMYIGVGDGKAGGSGIMNFADVRIVKPVTLPATGAIDVTIKGDALKGFPDYAGAWPAAEVPANAIDNTTAKYLNFSNSGGTGGKTVMPCGFAVTPAIGATIVTGLTFTAANDSPDRDPINWTLYGSNGTIDGPWETIASGTIDDFSRGSRDRLAIGLDWPRNWKGVTPIGFANTVPFLSYKVQFTSVKRPLVANSMQIAEVELLGATSTAAPKANPIITKVVRAGGTSGNRDPIGVFDGNTQCLPTAPGGLMDGNMVYSDRTYPWNQTPKDLVGAEYVRIFNTDKGTPPATYTVTTSRLATIAVAHDDRNTPAQAPVDKIVAAFAAAGQFKDTGLDVFIYESASTPARPLSVFSADLPAGTYVFASEQSSNTMYIIGAMEKK